METVYLDHAATTPVRPEARDAMLPYLSGETFGNPSSAHRFGRAARGGLEQARRQVAAAVGAESTQVFFTSGGTEADNLAILGAAFAARTRGAAMRVVVSAIEHKAVMAAAHAVRRFGGAEETLRVGADGVLDLGALDVALETRPAIVSVMWVNNETGVVQPVAEVGRRCRAAGVLFHTDAVQAFGNLPLRFADLPCDLLTVSAHKVGGPKGIGALLVRDRRAIEPLIQGGGQQGGLRSGTENIAGAVGFARAAELAAHEQPEHARRLAGLRQRLAERLSAGVPDLAITAERSERVAHILNVCVPGADSGALLMHLDLAGIAVSSGSACTSGATDPSPVLVAMGIPPNLAACAVRLSLGRDTTEAQVDRVADVFPGIVTKVRALTGAMARA